MGQGNVGITKQEPVVRTIQVSNGTPGYHYYGMGKNNRGFGLNPGGTAELSSWNHQIIERLKKYANDTILTIDQSPQDSGGNDLVF